MRLKVKSLCKIEKKMTSVPPLMCSTPPPIEYEENDEDSGLSTTLTLEEEDDVFGEYTLSHGVVNLEEASLPPSLVQSDHDSSTTSGITETPPLVDKHNNNYNLSEGSESITDSIKSKDHKAEILTPLAEAYNYDISESHKCQVSGNLKTVLPVNAIDGNQSSNLDEKSVDILSQNSETESPIESLSLNSERDVNCNASDVQWHANETVISETTKNIQNDNINIVTCHAVIIEDIPDDSSDDEMHSPKKVTYDDEFDVNSSEFFSIHTIEDINNCNDKNKKTITTTREEPSSTVENVQFKVDENKLDDDDDGDFSEFSTFEKINDKGFENENLNNETSVEMIANNCSFEADFTQFKFESDIKNIPETTKNINDIKKLQSTANIELEDDDFDDFQDFSSAADSDKTHENKDCTIELETKINTQSNLPSDKNPQHSHENDNINNDDNNNDDDDDDEFGNFTDATVQNVSEVEHKPVHPMKLANFHERVKKILESMFPIDPTTTEDDSIEIHPIEKNENILNLGTPDTARALEFQWTGSETRNALIRALGIDTRNILFGENWNPSMPRFAANLSCNPLKPMKSQSSSNNTTTNADYSIDNVAPEGTVAVEKKKHETDAADIDWSSSNLANPFDGSKEILQPREIEEIQSESSIAEQQEKPSNITETIDESTTTTTTSTAIDTTTTTSTGISTTATTTLSTSISTDSFSNRTHNTTNNNNNSINNKCSENIKDHNLQTINITDVPIGVNCIKLNATSIESTLAQLPHEIDLHDIHNQSDKNIASTNSHDKVNSTTQQEHNNNINRDNNDEDEIIATSTYAGPSKEVHIYTPSRGEGNNLPRTVRTTPINPASPSVISRAEPIDFDYEKAAAGIIIDETVVKKEYRDVEYNPSFGVEYNNMRSSPNKGLSPILDDKLQLENVLSAGVDNSLNATKTMPTDFDDDFTEFQSVPAPTTLAMQTKKDSPTYQHAKQMMLQNSADEMILSPAVLLPQAVSILNTKQKPKIEWGETVTNINPDELARIEELFSQPKLNITKDNVTMSSNNSQKSTPKHQATTTTTTSATHHQHHNSPLTISATIARKENVANNVDDEDWSDFVSVPVVSKTSTLTTVIRNEEYMKSNKSSSSNSSSSNINTNNNNINNNDDDWSDFVSSAPASSINKGQTMQSQFNNSAWQNANFYNNPLSLYHTPQQQHKIQQHNMHNNNFNFKESRNQIVTSNFALQQQIHILQDFSTAPPVRQYVPQQSVQQQQQQHNLAPSISLIPDLSFVAPAMSSNTPYVNALPKTSFNMKK